MLVAVTAAGSASNAFRLLSAAAEPKLRGKSWQKIYHWFNDPGGTLVLDPTLAMALSTVAVTLSVRWAAS